MTTLLEFVRLRLSEAEKEPISPGTAMLVDAVDVLADYVECQGAIGASTRRQFWCAAYLTKLGCSTMRGHSDCRTAAKIAALEAVVDYDAFVAAEVPA